MKIKNLTIHTPYVPAKLRNIPQPPKRLFVAGTELDTLLAYPLVTMVGTRKISAYGKETTTRLATELAQAGVGIVSGLAIGVDGLAHRAALEAGAPTIAVLPGALDRIYPDSHYTLAHQIVEQGGALVTEYPEGTRTYKNNFIERNRIASGLGDVLLITEAAENSGTMHTARFALEQGRDVLAVPGNITSPGSRGTNNLIKSGATPVTDVGDILNVLGISPQKIAIKPKSSDPREQKLLELIESGMSNGAELIQASGLDASIFNQTLTMLEIRGHIRPLGNNHWALRQ